MNKEDFFDDLEDLSSAEDFLEYFAIEFDQKTVHVNRLHIMQRFHDYLQKAGELPEQAEALAAVYKSLLTRSYKDFVDSDAQTEKVFKVFHMNEPQVGFVSVDQLLGS